jgi:gluconate 2-dehydrogenase gamma chain
MGENTKGSKNSPTSPSRRNFLRIGAGVVAGAAVAASVGIPFASGSKNDSHINALQAQLTSSSSQVTSLSSQLSTTTQSLQSSQSTASALQIEVDTTTAFLTLNTIEQAELTAIASAIIPSDSSGPGATEAGAVYFIDRQLKSVYGTNGLLYQGGPHISANSNGPITVDGITYPAGTANVRVGAGTRWQYDVTMRQFWTLGLAGIEAYANAAYGGNFETLSAANQTACLTDLWNNKPTYGSNSSQFGSILPSDFAYELFFMVWNGFWVDPVYGGNKNMVGWAYVGFYGTNTGNFYGEGYNSKQLMVATTPITLMPASLGQLQKGSP